MRVFDPGWRGPQAKAGAQDTDTEDWGNDPPGALDRHVLGHGCPCLCGCPDPGVLLACMSWQASSRCMVTIFNHEAV